MGAPFEVFIKDLGTFRVAGHSSRKPRWGESRVENTLGDFGRPRPVQLANPVAGLTGSRRHQGVHGPNGVADISNADTSREGIIGAGPKVTSVALTSTSTLETGETVPGTMASDASAGTNAWTDPTNVAASDDAYATVATAGGTRRLKSSNFGLATSGTIVGIEVEVERSKVVASADTGAVSPGTLANDSAAGTNAWTNPSNAASSNNTYATCATDGLTQYLKATNLGLSIPTLATILGIKLEIERKADSLGSGATVEFTQSAGSEDGYVRSGSSGDTASGIPIGQAGGIKTQGVFRFDTSSIPDSATITSARLKLYAQDTTVLGVDIGYYDHGGTITSADYNASPSDPVAGFYQPSGSLGYAYYNLSNLTNISKTGNTGFRFNFPSAFASYLTISSYEAGSSQWPVLEVTYSVPGALDSEVKLVLSDGSIYATNKADTSTYYTTSDVTVAYGGAADLWGRTWTAAELNDADFGAVLIASIGTGVTASVDHMKITVYYSIADVVDAEVRLVVGGVVVGTDQADTVTQWPASDTAKVYGGPTDLWGLTPTSAEVNASTFGVVLRGTITGGGTARVDRVRVNVYYRASVPGDVSKIWSDALDANGQRSRYIYCLAGSRLHVVDPTIDTEKETTDFGATVDGGDAALWAGRWWVALRGASTDYVREVVKAYDGLSTGLATTDFTARAIHAGPDALYRAYVSGENRALAKKSTVVAAATKAVGTLTLAGNAANTETVVLGTKTYTFQTVLTNVDGNVLIGANASASIDNLVAAITLGTGAGTLYAAATTANSLATATQGAGDTMTATALLSGLAGNSIASTETMGSGSWGAAALAGAVDALAADTNWAPSSGEQMGDPSITAHRLATLGERLVVGKEDGVGELDSDFTYRHYLEWMRDFRWDLQANGILPLGQGGEMLVTHRRGLHLLPQNVAVGVETLPAPHDAGISGRYTDVTFDGTWVYAALEHTEHDESHIVRMRRRRTPGPGMFEHHPIVDLTAAQVLDFYLWPGAVVAGVTYAPRLYFSGGLGTLSYIVVEDESATFTSGEWSVAWPLDDYGTPGTLKLPYRISCHYEHVTDTDGIKWQVRASDDDDWVDMDSDGSGQGGVAVVHDGYHHRYGSKDNAQIGRQLAIRCVGEGSALALQQRIDGLPVLTLIEQPETVTKIEVTLQLEAGPHNDASAEAQWRSLFKAGPEPRIIEARFSGEGDISESRRFDAMLSEPAIDADMVSGADEASGVIFAKLTIRGLEYGEAP